MFAMFFGAGNIVFPLAVGQFTQDKNFFGIAGLILTAVLVPFMGLLAMLLYNGDYTAFFRRIGRGPGFFLSALIMAVIGPFGGIPRCIAISHSTLTSSGFSGLSLPLFSVISCGLIYLFTFRRARMLTLLGYVLTPILLLSLAVIMVKGLILMPAPEATLSTKLQTFSLGFLEGYKTMDLLAAFFFSSVVLLCLKREEGEESLSRQQMIRIVGYASVIAASLLALIYICFSFVAAGYSADLHTVPSHRLLGTLAYKLLGPYAGVLASVAVSFACLTTEIALAAIFAEFLQKTLSRGKLSYSLSLVITLAVGFIVSTFQFEGISALLAPLLVTFYPALIALSVLNILHKVYGYQPVKRVFYAAVGLSLLLQFVR